MTEPYQRWNDLFQVVMALDEDFLDFHADEEAAMLAEVSQTTTARLTAALADWHEAFDDANDDDVARVIANLNPSYYPDYKFGDSRRFAEWIREHLETELAERAAGRRQEPPPPPPRPRIEEHAPHEFTLKPPTA